MLNFMKTLSGVALLVGGLMLLLICISAILFTYNQELALFIMQYIIPIFFLLFFVSIFNDSYEER
jgi:uncharacterized integral membrane protein